MEDTITKIPTAEILQDKSIGLDSSCAGLLNLKPNIKEEINQEIINHGDDVPGNYNNEEVRDPDSSKNPPQTLIEHAFKVVKNLFSPDKSKNKSPNVQSPISHQHQSASGSPCNSVYVPKKPEFLTSESEIEIHTGQPVSGENSLKDQILMNQMGIMQSSLPLDPHNSTDDSFLTTVSLIDESFQSAVTHFDENGESLKNCLHPAENCLNNSRVLDLMDETLENSGYSLENTTLRNGSFASEGAHLSNISNVTKDGITESLNNSQVSFASEKTVIENPGYFNNPEGHNGFLEKMGNIPNESEKSLCSNSEITKSDLKLPAASDHQQISNNEMDESTGNLPLFKSLDNHADLYNSSERGSPVLNGIRGSSSVIKSIQGENKVQETKETFSETEVVVAVEEENLPRGSISTTTVVLNSVDSNELDNVLSLKSDDSATNTSSLTSLEGVDDLDNMPQKQFTKIGPCENSPNTVSCVIGIKCEEDKTCKSEGSSPSKTTDANKNKLNKSYDFINQKNSRGFPKVSRNVHEVKATRSCTDISQANSEASESRTRNSRNEDFENLSDLEFGKREPEPSTHNGGVSLVPQGSYTVLSVNENLNRPVIDSSVGAGSKPSPESEASSGNSTKISETVGDPNDISCYNESFIKSSKQSTPLCGRGNNRQSGNGQAFGRPIALNLHSESTEEGHKVTPPKVSNSESPGKTTRVENPEEYSPVIPVSDSEVLHSGNFSEYEFARVSSHSFPSANNSWDWPATSLEEQSKNPHGKPNPQKLRRSPERSSRASERKSLSPAGDKANQTYELNLKSPENRKQNQTFDKVPELSGGRKLNQTFDKKSTGENRLNLTYDKKSESPDSNPSNQTFEKKSENLNQTFDVKKMASPGVILNETFDKRTESPETSNLNQTYDKKSEFPLPRPLNQTFSKEPNVTNQVRAEEPEGLNKTFEKKEMIREIVLEAGDVVRGSASPEKSISPEMFSNRNESEEKNIENLDFGTARELLNGSFVSLGSSNTSKDQTVFLDDKPSVSPRDEKLQCDPELARLIKEQFSSTDIEKICSVVEDLSSMKLSSDILRASEQFDKSFHESLSTGEFKPPQTEPKPEATAVDPLSPQSFEFLSSIRGKPTGRDFSRESLYVKFDPLVQPSQANSLIDFTKEVEALESVPQETEQNKSLCEQLLAISPQKKPDDIVPPLTPLSHKSKSSSSEDKGERLKELQNEIYFLKNLYAEREKANKSKMESFESQIAQLTAQNCFLEDKLKETNEREKSLVKKMKEQTQNIGQLTVIMEEYAKVISKLTAELDSARKENGKQIEALTAERDSYVAHLQNTEAAFTDVHAKYEKSKKTIASLRTNEAMFRTTIAEQTSRAEEMKEKGREAQEKAARECQRIQEELNELKTTHSHETARLRAQLRKTELKLEAMQESLDQKIKENQKLTAICDDLIEGKK